MTLAKRQIKAETNPAPPLKNGRSMLDHGFMLFHPGFVAIADGKTSHGLFLAAMVAQQVWHEEQGLYEWPCTMDEWQQRLGLSVRQIRSAVQSFAAQGIISTARRGRPPVRYYCLEWDLFEEKWLRAVHFPFSDWYCGTPHD